MDIVTAPRLIRKRFRKEVKELDSLVDKMKLLVRKNSTGSTPPDPFGGRAFLEAEAWRPDTKKKKTMHIAKIIAPAQEEHKVAYVRKRKMTPPLEVLESKTPESETVSHGSGMSSLPAMTPMHMEKKNVVTESRSPIGRRSPCQIEEGEIIEEDETDDAFIDICGGLSPVNPSPLLLLDDESSPSSSRSSGSSCSDSSSSDSDDSDDADDCAESRPPPAQPCKVDIPLEEGELIDDSSVTKAEKFLATVNSPKDEEPVKPVKQPHPVKQSEKSVAPAPEMSDLVAMARAKKRQVRREKAYEELEAMERNVLQSNWIDTTDMTEFGITTVEHLLTCEHSIPGVSGPVQQLIGLSWKGE